MYHSCSQGYHCVYALINQKPTLCIWMVCTVCTVFYICLLLSKSADNKVIRTNMFQSILASQSTASKQVGWKQYLAQQQRKNICQLRNKVFEWIQSWNVSGETLNSLQTLSSLAAVTRPGRPSAPAPTLSLLRAANTALCISSGSLPPTWYKICNILIL